MNRTAKIGAPNRAKIADVEMGDVVHWVGRFDASGYAGGIDQAALSRPSRLGECDVCGAVVSIELDGCRLVEQLHPGHKVHPHVCSACCGGSGATR